jgi:TIR domain
VANVNPTVQPKALIMSKFFISYSRADMAFADKLRQNILRVDNAHKVFLDRFGLNVGSNIKAVLAKRIEWCDYFILILSQRSLKSKWVAYELQRVKRGERKTGEKKLFVIQPGSLGLARLPKALADNLILEFFLEDDFPADFFRLMHAIYERPTFYAVEHEVGNDPDGGYLFSMWIECDDTFLELIDFVEYRFDYEFDYTVEYNQEIIDGAVHKAENRRERFEVRDLWITEPITVFVGIYLKNTRVIFFRKFIEVGLPVN